MKRRSGALTVILSSSVLVLSLFPTDRLVYQSQWLNGCCNSITWCHRTLKRGENGRAERLQNAGSTSQKVSQVLLWCHADIQSYPQVCSWMFVLFPWGRAMADLAAGSNYADEPQTQICLVMPLPLVTGWELVQGLYVDLCGIMHEIIRALWQWYVQRYAQIILWDNDCHPELPGRYYFTIR